MQNHNLHKPQKLFVEQLVALIPNDDWRTPDGYRLLTTTTNETCPFEIHFYTITHMIIVRGHFTGNHNVEIHVKIDKCIDGFWHFVKETTKTLTPEETIQYLATTQDSARKIFNAVEETEYQLQRLFNEID